MSLTFTKSERIALKANPDFAEKWVQERIAQDPAMLGLGDDVQLVAVEKVQPRAGRLDLLLHDEQLNRRYEVELMLGATDPSHIIRSIEYWDIERRRYPAYDHVAVLIAEDITSRFLNVMALLAGSIPLIAIQLVALRVDDKVCLHFVRVLDQTALRDDDTFVPETKGGPTDRAYWEKQTGQEVLARCDAVAALTQELTTSPIGLLYRKVIIGVTTEGGAEMPIWLKPGKTLLRVGAYVANPEAWVKRFDELGQLASIRRGNKAVLVSFKPEEFDPHKDTLQEFLKAAISSDDETNAA
ncbi:MAG TPA: hypothetical protein VJ783_10070 [Pirellulales bacterium]|nr:hypothetical protein [Pirellulales bacterium]